MKQVSAIVAGLLLVAALIGCSHFSTPNPDSFKYEPAKEWPNGPLNAPRNIGPSTPRSQMPRDYYHD